MSTTCENFHEMENVVCEFCDDSVLFPNCESSDLPGTYIYNVFSTYFQEMVIQDIRSVSDDWDLIAQINEVTVDLPEEILEFYKTHIDIKRPGMPHIEMKKHQVYKMLTKNLDWFTPSDGADIQRYRSRTELEHLINAYLMELNPPPKDYYQIYNPPYTTLYAATLTAMVNDGVLERTRDTEKDVYRYRPVLPINEDYINGY